MKEPKDAQEQCWHWLTSGHFGATLTCKKPADLEKRNKQTQQAQEPDTEIDTEMENTETEIDTETEKEKKKRGRPKKAPKPHWADETMEAKARRREEQAARRSSAEERRSKKRRKTANASATPQTPPTLPTQTAINN